MKWTVLVALTAVVIAGGAWFFMRGRDDGPQYQTMQVMRGDLTNLVTATGTLNPVVNVTVGSQVSGIIDKLYVDYNSMVKSNQVIAEIDPSTYQAAVEQARADLANAKADLELQVVEAKRDAELFTNKLISDSDYDTQVATRDEAAATVQIKQAALDDALANLSYCKIRSPVDGIVIARDVDVGQTVASSFNTPVLFQIANDLTKMQIDASVDEADIGGVKDGQLVDFTVDAFPNRTYYGSVAQVRNAPTTVNNVVTYDTVIAVTNSDYSLMPGMTASVNIIVARRDHVLEIPNSALRFRPVQDEAISSAESGGPRPGHGHGAPAMTHLVYVLSQTARDPKLGPVQIRTGITDNIYTEVLSGLNEGDNVVIGLKIPGLSGDNGTDNPFSMRRRF